MLQNISKFLIKIDTTYLSYILLIILIILIFLTSTANARFINADRSPAQFQSVKDTIFYLNSSSGRCTANLISNQGHFLTARHCLQRCLIPQGVFKLSQDSPAGTKFFTLDESKLGSATCEIELNHKFESVSIEATSPGLILKIDERSFQILAPMLFFNLVDQGFTSEGDFVIFKSKSYTNALTCLNLVEEQTLNQNHNVFSFPSETSRPDGFNSDGHSLYYSSGFLNPDIFNNSCLENTKLTDLQQINLARKFSFTTSFLSSVDAIYGSSGSSVFDDDLNIIGILTNVYSFWSITREDKDKPENLYCEGSAKTLKTSTILKYLKDQNFDTSKLRCEQSPIS